MTITSNEDVQNYLATAITAQLQQDKRVVWLIPGGSAISIAVAVSRLIPSELKHNVTVSLTDERYGALHHSDSNWEQLTIAGFDFSNFTIVPVLNGSTREETTQQFNDNLKVLLDSSEYSIGFFGIGPDGHTAGILPGSDAVHSTEYATTYDAASFQRITMTPKAIGELNEAVAYASGEAKWPIVQQLKTTITIEQQPAQLLKSVPKFTLFTDYKGELS